MKKIFDLINTIAFKIGNNNTRISIARRMGVKVGEGCRIYGCNFGSEPYLISIGNNCEVTAGVNFITHDGATWIFRKNGRFNGTKYGPIVVKDNCMIGIKSIILPNIEIGPNSIVGAGSIVTKTVPPNSIYAGNPAEYVCGIDEYLENCYKKNTGSIPSNNKKEILLKMFENRLI